MHVTPHSYGLWVFGVLGNFSLASSRLPSANRNSRRTRTFGLIFLPRLVLIVSIMVLLDPVTMSAPIGKATASQTSKTKEGETSTQAVRTIASSQAQIVKHVHSVLLLSSFFMRFNALVADPVSTMSNSVPIVAAIQAVYAIVCLPAVGSHVAKPAKKLRPGEKRKSGSESTGPNVAVVCLRPLYICCA